LERHEYIDKSKVAIWGWSYGGFVSAHVIEQGGFKTFRCAASVAPVTNFRYYDATYTEKYLGLYNEADYVPTDLTRNVSAFKQVRYLLIHGTADDNVHFQNSATFIKALTAENVQFDLMVYPDSRHALANERAHLYTMLNRFFGECFSQPTRKPLNRDYRHLAR